MSQNEEYDLEDLNSVLEETHVQLLQQVLAHASGVLSFEELAYRNPDVSSERLQNHVGELQNLDLLVDIEVDEQYEDLPVQFYAVSEKGIQMLQETHLYDEIEIWKQVYNKMDLSDRIKEIEQKSTRPEPSWY